jgi:serine/threonine protein kinase
MKRVSGTIYTVICEYCGTDNLSSAAACRTCGSSLQNAPVKPSNPISTTSSDHLTAGTFLHAGRYLILDVLGQGGFGITYKALDTQGKRNVAIKEFFPDGAVTRDQSGNIVPRKSSVRDFERGKLAFGTEAAKLRTFRHPSIVHVFDNFVERNTAYLVMEFLDGETLENRIQSGKLLGENEARNLLYSLLEALTEVHARGVLHLDIKPANIVLTDERPELIDFGTARHVIHGEATRVSQRILTPAYAPLEQYATDARLGPWTDLYALAATFYEAVTGVKPPSALERANGVKLEPIRKHNPLIRQGFAEALERALQLQIDQRPQTVQDWSRFMNELWASRAKTPSRRQVTVTNTSLPGFTFGVREIAMLTGYVIAALGVIGLILIGLKL